MFKTIKALFRAVFNLVNIITGLINIGGKAMADASEEYDAWSDRRKTTKANLKDFYAEYDTVQELMDNLADVDSMEDGDAKNKLKAKLEKELTNYINAD